MQPTPTYATEIERTRPDFILYRPSGEFEPDSENQQVIVTSVTNGDFVAAWTMATRENAPDQRVVISRSRDRGKTWSAPVVIDGRGPDDPPGVGLASWPFFVHASRLHRLYLFYNKNVGVKDCREDVTGVLRFRYSEDHGETWSRPYDHLTIRRTPLDHPDPAMPVNWVACFQSFRDAHGVPIEGWTRWRSGSAALFDIDSEAWFWRFENILDEPDPMRLRMTTLPDGSHGLRVPRRDRPEVSVAQEPMTVNLPDGRLFCVMRTLNGHLAYSLGTGDASEWTDPRPLRYDDSGDLILHPISPAPIYELGGGRFLLLYHDNDGTAFGASGPGDYRKNRRPVYATVGTFAPGDRQPVRFGPPRVLFDTDGVAIGPNRRVEPASYPSFFEYEGVRYLWYPDRKHFVLGKRITDAMLASEGNEGP